MPRLGGRAARGGVAKFDGLEQGSKRDGARCSAVAVAVSRAENEICEFLKISTTPAKKCLLKQSARHSRLPESEGQFETDRENPI